MSQQINLFNPIFLKQKKHFSALAMVQALGGIVLGMLVFYAYARYQVGNLGASVAETAKRLELEQSRLTKVAAEFAPGKNGKLLENQAAQLTAQLGARQKVIAVLQGGELGNTGGFSEYLRAYSRQAIDGLWLTGFTIHGAGSQMTLDGRAMKAELVPAYIRRLNQEKVMQGKAFAAMEIGRPAPAKAEGAAANEAPAQARFVEFKLMSAEREAAR
ncbi:MAG: PilN domain-containing protein [Sulfuricella sp.]|nr:PilN domain-containing protein [Sulfuricella sp.]